MPLKKKSNGSKMAELKQDDRTPAQKAKAKALFESKKKQAESEGEDFDTPQYLQKKAGERKEKILRSLAVGGMGGAMSMMPISSFTTPYIPAAQAVAAEFASKVIPKQKRKGQLYETITKPRLIKKSK